MNKQNAVFTLLLMMGSIFSHSTMAKTPVANTPVDQSDYEPLHQGLLQLNVTLSTAPCNLSINAKGLPLLTGCGAGFIFNDMNALNTMAKTPASLQFYDVHKKYFHPLYPVKLRNGDNPIQAPFKKNHNNIYRLEVSYE